MNNDFTILIEGHWEDSPNTTERGSLTRRGNRMELRLAGVHALELRIGAVGGNFAVQAPEPWLLYDLEGAGSNNNVAFGANQAVEGRAKFKGGLNCKTLDVVYDGLDNWIGPCDELTYTPPSISFEYISAPVLTWSDGMRSATVTVATRSVLGTRGKDRLHIDEWPILSVETAKAMSVDELFHTCSGIVALFELLSGNSFGVSLATMDADTKKEANLVRSWTAPKSARYSLPRELVSFELAKPHLRMALDRWLPIFDSIRLAIDLYRSAKYFSVGGNSLRFFSIVTAIDSLYVYQGGNDGRKLVQKLKEIANRYADTYPALLPKSECHLIADARNAIGHIKKDRKQKPASQRWLLLTSYRLECLFEVMLLEELGFPPGLLKTMADRCARRHESVRLPKHM